MLRILPNTPNFLPDLYQQKGGTPPPPPAPAPAPPPPHPHPLVCNIVSKIVRMIRKYHNHKLQTNPWHHEEGPHNNHETPGRQTSSLFPIEMIAKLELTQSNAQQNTEQLREQQSTTNQQQQNHRLRTDSSQSLTMHQWRVQQRECSRALIVLIPGFTHYE